MMGNYSTDDVMLDQPDDAGGADDEQQQPPDAAAGAKPQFTYEPLQKGDWEPLHPEDFIPEKPKQPGWMSLAWDAVKGAGSQANPFPLLKQLYDESTGQFKDIASKSVDQLTSGSPVEMVRGAAGLVSAPGAAVIGTGEKMLEGLTLAQWDQFKKAKEAFRKGDYTEAFGRTLAGAMPVVGPAAAATGEELQEGIATGDQAKMAHAAGAGLANVGTMLLPDAAASLKAKAAESIAPAIETYAGKRITRAVSPQLGPGKLKYGEMAAKSDVQSTLLRDPEMGAWTVDTLQEKVQGRRTAANTALQAEYDKIPNTRMYPTAPIIKRIDDAIRELSSVGISGKVVEPATRASQLEALQTAKSELKKLGSNANIDALRNLQTSWGEGARKVYTPSIQTGAAAEVSAGEGWASAREALQGFITEREPQLKAVNADYNLWRRINDVLNATVQTERVRPTIGRQMLGGGIAAGSGFAHGGSIEALAAGTIVSGMIEVAHEMGLTSKITTARTLAKLADALKTGTPSQQMSALRTLAATTGQGKELDEALRRARGGSQ